jgi:hypothetical protein
MCRKSCGRISACTTHSTDGNGKRRQPETKRTRKNVSFVSIAMQRAVRRRVNDTASLISSDHQCWRGAQQCRDVAKQSAEQYGLTVEQQKFHDRISVRRWCCANEASPTTAEPALRSRFPARAHVIGGMLSGYEASRQAGWVIVD